MAGFLFAIWYYLVGSGNLMIIAAVIQKLFPAILF